ncbi:MAG: peptidase M28 [Dehalococcoidales bacterium]|jgi:heat shock protein HtpX|nr:peptidase M28 [Dehalococcoidales bacterium]|tara:strand:- start:2935 stop:4146 length:1212 start_codon:yes stop_codon:yes gene_type:complete
MWEQIRSNQIRTIVLVAGMGLLLLVIGYLAGLYFFNDPITGLVIALIVWAVMNMVAFFQGDSILLALSKAKKIKRDDHPRLYNIVEEMKIASGLEKMPDIYIIDDPALNAFATGRNPDKASVAITSGLLNKLNRDELQGVIAHELAHIKNRDVLLMSITAVLLGTIVILAFFVSRFMIFGSMGGTRRSSSSGGGQATLIIFIVAIVLMILAPILAQLIYFAISRKREYMADASSALYTRYPEGLASALEKLAASTGQLKSASKATAPMYIINPFRKKGMAAANLTSTHPPISERIRILRRMDKGASFVDYDQAYQQLHKTDSGGIISAPTIAATGAVGLRAAAPGPKGKEPDRLSRTRETDDLLWRQSNYKLITCDCGTKLRIPPKFKESSVRCPHCGKVHPL